MADLKHLPLFAALVLAGACSQPVVKATPADVTSTQTADVLEVHADDAAAKLAADQAAKAEAALPKLDLTPDILFKFLVAEVAGQRGAIGVAQSAYMDLARQTRDPRIARRAAEVSVFARDQAGALEATRLWAAGEQDSERAQQTLAALLLNENKIDEAEPILRTLFKEDPAKGFMQLSALMGKMRDTQAALAMVERLAADHPKLPEARFAVAQAAANAGRVEVAIAALKQAERLRPGWEVAALMHAQVLGKTSRADALGFMRDFLVTYPGAREVRLAYARTLVNANQFTEARAEFNRLTRDFPRNIYATLAMSLKAAREAKAGDYKPAAADLQWAAAHAPDAALQGLMQLRLARVQMAMQQPRAALATLAAIDPHDYRAEAAIARGDAQLMLGNQAAARAAYDQALADLKPDSSQRGLLKLKLDNLAIAGK